MKRFRFPLQAVLTIRENEEKKALEVFATAQAEVEKIAVRQRALRRAIDELFGCRREAFGRTTSSEEFQQMQNGLRSLQQNLKQCELDMYRAQAVLTEKTRLLLEARQKREVVEKVYDKQLAAYKLHAARTEQKVIDDLATMRPAGAIGLKWK